MLSLSFFVLKSLVLFLTVNLHPLSFFILASFYSSEECFALNCDNGTLASTTTSTLRLLVLLPSSLESGALHRQQHHHSWNYGRDIILPALDLATEQINNRSDLLPCHKLELVYKETECGTTTDALFGLINGLFSSPAAHHSVDEKVVVGVIGPVCPYSAIQTSVITNLPEIRLVMLHDSDSSLLTNRKRYPYSLGILGHTESLVNLLVALVKESGWFNITILYDSSFVYYSTIMNDFIDSVKRLNVTINYVSTDLLNFYPLHQVKVSKTRIVFTFTPLEYSKRIMCMAHHVKLAYPDYQWVFINQRLGDFTCKDIVYAHQQGRHYSCSCKLLSNTILEGAILVSYQMSANTSPKETKPLQNLSFSEFLEHYDKKVSKAVNSHNNVISQTRWAYNMYDALWAWGVVLDRLTTTHSGLTFEYGNEDLAELTLNEFYSLNFQGMSGHIKLNTKSGFIDRPANLYQVTNGHERHIAYCNRTTVVGFKRYNAIPDVVSVVNLPHFGIVVFLLATHFIQLTTVILLHILTFMYRNTKFVKASSPKLVQPAFVGTYVLILCMIVNTLFFVSKLSPVVGTIMCNAVWIWLLPLSYTLMMGIITLRAWRLYRIFIHYLHPGKFISNSALLSTLLILALIDILIAIVRTIIDPMKFQFIKYTFKEDENSHPLVDQSCYSNSLLLWVALVFSYKIGLLLVMIVLSVLTHRIPNQTFSTKLLRVFSYVFSFTFIVGFSLYYFYILFDHLSNTDFYILNGLLLVTFIVFVILVLLPPLLPVIQLKLKMFH